MSRLSAALLAAGWSPDAPVVVVHKASWPGEQKIVRGTVATVAGLCRAAKIVTQSMVIASPTLGARHWKTLAKSKLYDPSFTHRFRRASVPSGSDALAFSPYTPPVDLINTKEKA